MEAFLAQRCEGTQLAQPRGSGSNGEWWVRGGTEGWDVERERERERERKYKGY